MGNYIVLDFSCRNKVQIQPNYSRNLIKYSQNSERDMCLVFLPEHYKVRAGEVLLVQPGEPNWLTWLGEFLVARTSQVWSGDKRNQTRPACLVTSPPECTVYIQWSAHI
jgi:hypothetical protein